MEIPKIHEGEYRFCLILWEHGPIAAAQLARLCQEQLGWKADHDVYSHQAAWGARRPEK